ncbi:MAG: hypothetical protein CMC18_08375 [Flavobacteriaceae bacterium]|nr:hypothetical protein [Flavobacteriaceae bacterium]
MKKRVLLLLTPLLMAFQCEEDPYFGTEYGIQNNSSYNLIIFFEEAGEVLIQSQSYQYISKSSNSNSFIPPSEASWFRNNEIKLYREDSNGDLFLTYEQNPILNDLWTPDPDSQLPDYYYYKLIITDDLLE